MAEAKRATVYFESDVHKALRLKAAETERSVSDLVNEAVRAQLAEDEDDLRAFRRRAKEPAVPFEAFLKDLKRRGKL
jgi:plasmid stability protein